MSTDMNMLSPVATSNLFCKAAAAKKDPRQAIPDKAYTMPDLETRRHLAKMIWEEALETVEALGFYPSDEDFKVLDSNYGDGRPKHLEDIIDGCCDTIFVATGAIVALGAPDWPHLLEVCAANNRKFPDGVATVDATGKYLKPSGWQPPNHQKIMVQYHDFSMLREQVQVIQGC